MNCASPTLGSILRTLTDMNVQNMNAFQDIKNFNAE